MQNKRGLSTIVVTLILVLLSVVAVGVVWVVIANILDTGTEQTTSTFGALTLNLQVDKVQIEDNGDISVTIKRGKGEGDLTGLNLVISDGKNSQTIKQSETINELGTKTFTIAQSELTGVTFVKEISVAPITQSSSGSETQGGVVDTKTFNNKQILENMGAIAWWRFDENARDDIGGSSGTLNGENINFVDGKYGSAVEFDAVGTDEFIDITSVNSKLSKKDGTILAWAYPTASGTNKYIINGNKNARTYLQWHNGDFRAVKGNPALTITLSSSPALNNWYHLGVSWKDGVTIKGYFNGDLINTLAFDGGDSEGDSLQIGTNEFPGKIDEVIIFNRTLTDNEVKGIYTLDLS